MDKQKYSEKYGDYGDMEQMDLSAMSRDELYEKARDLDVPVKEKMSDDELRQRIASALDE